jgi:Holliday junction DNA helicase RuvB
MTDKNQVSINDVEFMLPLERIAGQPQVVATLQMHLAAYWNERQLGMPMAFGPLFLAGPSGTGKTLVAHAVHESLANLHLIETIGENLNDLETLYSILMQADENTTVFIDECQGMGTAAQHVLLKALAEHKLCVPKAKSSQNDYQIPLANFVAIFATTHEFCLQEALRSRMKIYCRFDYYRVEDLANILRQRAKQLGWKWQTPEIFTLIAQRSKRTPRIAIRHLETCYQVTRSQGEDMMTLDHVRKAFELSEIDDLGLDHLERSYLKLLIDENSLRLNVLSARLGLPNRTIQEVVEPYLLQVGFLSKEGSLRMLTEKGESHIQGSIC